MTKNIEVCLSPVLFEYSKLNSNCLIVVIDVLRAPSCFSAIFDRNATSILPVEELETLRKLKQKGYLIAAERGGEKIDFADFGNSPTLFLQKDFSGKAFAYSTTNGTKSIIAASKTNNNIITACFNNLDAAVSHILNSENDILLFCSGWQNNLSLEDMACAGAIINKIKQFKTLSFIGDAAGICEMVWNELSKNFPTSLQIAKHYQRLKKIGMEQDLEYCFQLNASSSLPVWNGKELTLVG